MLQDVVRPADWPQEIEYVPDIRCPACGHAMKFDKQAYQSLSHRLVGELSNTGVGGMRLNRGRPVQFHRPLDGPQKGRLPLLGPWGQGPAPRGLATAP